MVANCCAGWSKDSNGKCLVRKSTTEPVLTFLNQLSVLICHTIFSINISFIEPFSVRLCCFQLFKDWNSLSYFKLHLNTQQLRLPKTLNIFTAKKLTLKLRIYLNHSISQPSATVAASTTASANHPGSASARRDSRELVVSARSVLLVSLL